MMNEQKQQRGKHMADKQEEQTTGTPNLDAEREELLQATQQRSHGSISKRPDVNLRVA